MPFELLNAPAAFQGGMHVVLLFVRWKSALLYLDGIVVPSNTVEDHTSLLRKLQTMLMVSGVALKPKSVLSWQRKIDFEGHDNRSGKSEIAHTTASAIKNLRDPANQTDLRPFRRSRDVLCSFLSNFSLLQHRSTRKSAEMSRRSFK